MEKFRICRGGDEVTFPNIFYAGRPKKKGLVFVGLSGGVDSSVSAALLQQEGYEVVGVYIRTWQPEWLSCSWREDRRDAMRVATHLGIPFLELDLSEEYKRGVVDYLIREYRAGRVPNPDIMCNREIKFGAFLNWAREQGAEYVATGHYARREDKNGKTVLLRGKDRNKDQSYFLWTLTPDQLEHILFPVGSLEKSEVRHLAKELKIPTSERPDSQGICFLGDVDMKEFLRHFIKEEKGEVLDEKGRVIGEHSGAFFFTLGERHGFHVYEKNTEGGPYYIIGKDVERNTITVAQKAGIEERGFGKSVRLQNVNDPTGVLHEGWEGEFQIRYRGSLKRGRILSRVGNELILEMEEEDYTLSPGQSIVFYEGDVCLGGGIVIA